MQKQIFSLNQQFINQQKTFGNEINKIMHVNQKKANITQLTSVENRNKLFKPMKIFNEKQDLLKKLETPGSKKT